MGIRIGVVAFAVATLALCGSVAHAARATDAPGPEKSILDADQKVVDAAQAAVHARGVTALKDFVSALRAVLDHAPHPYHEIEERPGVIYFRTNDSAKAQRFTLMRAAAATMGRKSLSIVNLADPYPEAAFLMGSYDNETSQFAAAMVVLDEGLALEPDYANLISEKAATVSMLNRHEESLAIYAKGLATIDPLTVDWVKARFLRGEGFQLTELGRYDEAEKVYRESLKLEPGHGGALHELAYIAQVRAGAARQGSVLLNGEDAAKPH